MQPVTASERRPNQDLRSGSRRMPVKIGLFSIGLDAYWPQFEGLRERLTGYNETISARLQGSGAEVVNLGLIDTPEKALAGGHEFRQSDVDLIFLHTATYSLSSTVLPVVRRAKVPVVVLNLSPGPAIDYSAINRMPDRQQMTGEWLAWCGSCPIPEIANVFSRCGIPFFQVTGVLDKDEAAWGEIEEWVQAAATAQALERNRLGLMGHYYGGMLDIYSDLTAHCAAFGGHMEMIEVEELAALREGVRRPEINERLVLFAEHFQIQPDCLQEDLEQSAITSVALDRLVETHRLGSVAYYYKGTGNPANEAAINSIILGNSLLTARGIPVAGEYELKNAQAMKIMDSFGAGGSFSEFYAIDFNDDAVLWGHDGPGHLAIAEGKVKVKPLGVYHGKVGRGLSVEMAVKNGPVTFLSVVESGGRLSLLIAHGQSVAGPILQIGNTNSRYRFPIGARSFVNEWTRHGPAHHCAIGVGHIASKLKKFGALLGLETVQVC